jgi:hypothetical protein
MWRWVARLTVRVGSSVQRELGVGRSRLRSGSGRRKLALLVLWGGTGLI